MKIIVTGALGHIGSYVIRELPLHFPSAQIVLIDNLMTQRYCSLFNLPSQGNYSFIEMDITRADLNSLLEGADVVIHLAAITDAAGSFGRAEQIENNNFNGTKRLAESCAKLGVRLISLSSTSVYGTQADLVDENCSEAELQPQSPYAATKLNEERIIQLLARGGGLKGVIFRFGTIYGASPGMRFHTAVNKFCWQAAMGQPITVWRTAFNQKRPYLDLFDAARAIIFVIQKDLFDGRIHNVLTQNTTVQDIVERIRLFVPGLKINFVDSEIMNQLSYEVSRERFLSEGFVYSGDLSRGIGETISLIHQPGGK